MVRFRDFKQQDCEYIVEHLNNPRVVKYLTSKIPFPYTTKDAMWWIKESCKEEFTKVIELNGEFVGVIRVEIGEFEYSRNAEIGYWIAESYWGKGIVSKAVAKMTKHVFSNTEVVRLFAPVYEPNKASMKVLKKCGYEQEGLFKQAAFKDGVFYNEYIFACNKI